VLITEGGAAPQTCAPSMRGHSVVLVLAVCVGMAWQPNLRTDARLLVSAARGVLRHGTTGEMPLTASRVSVSIGGCHCVVMGASDQLPLRNSHPGE
jgi:hypothetical protein